MADHLNANATETKVCNLQCIDLSNPDIHQSVALIKQACLDSGLFYLINHGISKELMDEAFVENKKFFEMPLTEKMKIPWKETYRGYQPPAQTGSVEAYTVGAGVFEDDTTNVWPPADILPGWKEAMRRYHRETFNVGRAVTRMIALALDLDIDFFNQSEILGEATASICTILHYGGQEIDGPKKSVEGIAHTDVGLITLLATDDVLGLQICKDKHAKPQIWEYVQPMKGAFIVNVGDVLERLSNNAFRSILHKVVHCEERYSIAFFVLPSYDYLVECLSNQVSKENPTKYPPIKFIDFWNSRYNDIDAAS